MKNTYFFLFFFICLLIISCNKQNQRKEKIEKNKEISQEILKNRSEENTETDKKDIEEKIKKKSQEKKESKKDNYFFKILYWGGLEGTLFPIVYKDKNKGGLVYLGTFILDKIKDSNSKNTFIISTGNLFSGDPKDRRPIIDILNLINMKISVVSNLELNYGIKKLNKILSKAKFKMISCNIYKNKKRVFLPYVIEKINNKKVAFIGITSQEVAVQTPKEMIKGLALKSPIKEISKVLKELKDKVDLIIILSNLRYEKDIEIAQKYTFLPLIIGRYIIDESKQITRIGNTYILRVRYKQGMELGEIKIYFNNNTLKIKYNYYDIDPSNYDINHKINKIIEKWKEKEKELNKILCESSVFLEGDYNEVRQRETNLGDLIADILLDFRKGSDIAIINSGCIRASLPKGKITKEMLLTALPYKNKVVELKLKGEVIKEVLENSVANYEKISGAFLQVAGISFKFDPYRPKFNRVLSIKIQGEDIDFNKYYRVVTLSYIADGGDDYIMLKNKKPLFVSQKTLQEIIEDYFKKHPIINIKTENRIIIIKK